MSTKTASETEQPAPISFAQFLEKVPPSQVRGVIGASVPSLGPLVAPVGSAVGSPKRTTFQLSFPEITLNCNDERCKGERVFRPDRKSGQYESERVVDLFIDFICSNCQSSKKTYALGVRYSGSGNTFLSFKYGEVPAFGPPIPPRLNKLIAGDREDFFKGRRCESQGLGIGAFAYYRRIVENQKGRIIDEIIAVAERTNAPQDVIESLRAAKKEQQYTKALESVTVPDSIKIKGENPLLLLHGALSEGIHAQTDQECLDAATDIRVVLAELAERVAMLLKSEQELETSLDRLIRKRQAKKKAEAAMPPPQAQGEPGKPEDPQTK